MQCCFSYVRLLLIKVHRILEVEKWTKRCWRTKQCGISGTDISNKKSLQSCLLFLWRNTGNGWPWIWISRPSTGRRHHHLLFVQPTLKKKKKEKKQGDKKTSMRWNKVNVCMPWACCLCFFLCILALINACIHLCFISLELYVGKVLAP